MRACVRANAGRGPGGDTLVKVGWGLRGHIYLSARTTSVKAAGGGAAAAAGLGGGRVLVVLHEMRRAVVLPIGRWLWLTLQAKLHGDAALRAHRWTVVYQRSRLLQQYNSWQAPTFRALLSIVGPWFHFFVQKFHFF